MPKITFIPDGQSARVIDIAEGVTLMEGARDNGIPGIIGDCGGDMSCGTCHGYIGEGFLSGLPDPSEHEQVMIDDGVVNPAPNSRLCCQIVVTSDLDGMTVTIPKQF